MSDETTKRLKEVISVLATGNPEVSAIMMRYRMSENENKFYEELDQWIEKQETTG